MADDPILSDGLPCIVRRLGIFELDDAVEPPDTGPFTYTVTIGDNEVTRPFPLEAWDEAPEQPGIIEPIQGSKEWWDWFESSLYWAAIYDKERKKEDEARYHKEVARYILSTCIAPEDKKRIVTIQDYQLVKHAATVPQISLNDLSNALRRSLRATFDGRQVLELILDKQDDDETEGARINGLRAWEIEALNASGLNEAQWGELTLQERARRIVGHQYKAWMEHLTLDKMKKDKVMSVG